MKPKLSVIIPAYNEQNAIAECLNSLKQQSYTNFEIIVVDDGSTDKTLEIVKKFQVLIHSQKHKGPGSARNLGVSKSKGEILVFVDADMTFKKDFLHDLTDPIIKGKTIGTFSKNEFVTNSKNTISKCWNINRNLPENKMIPTDHGPTSPVFRAIQKKEFLKVNGFSLTGEYTDDWSLSEKLNTEATLAKGAEYFHANPGTLKEVYSSARWFATNKFISGSFIRKIKTIIFFSVPFSLIIGLYKSFKFKIPFFFVFKLLFDFAVWTKVINLFVTAKKSK